MTLGKGLGLKVKGEAGEITLVKVARMTLGKGLRLKVKAEAGDAVPVAIHGISLWL